MAGDRLRRLKVSPELLVMMLRDGNEIYATVKHGLPKDVKFERAHIDPDTHAYIVLVVSSDEWEPVLWGDIIPIFDAPTICRTEVV